jgi:DNA-binding FadR family transcriptional regulator
MGTAPVTGIAARTGLTNQIANALGRHIVGGTYAPGTNLPNEGELSVQFDAGRSAVREAVKMLAAKGLVSSRPRRGTRVHAVREWNFLDPDVQYWLRESVPARDMLLELFEVRLGFECEAASLAAEHGKTDQITAIRRAYEAMEAAAEGKTDPIESDCAFHEAIVVATGNRFFQPLVSLIRTALVFSIRTTNAIFGLPVGDLAAHHAVLRAIERRDPRAARRAMRTLLEASAAAVAGAKELPKVV